MYLAINQLFLLVKKLESCGISFYFGLLSRMCRICIRRNFFLFSWGNHNHISALLGQFSYEKKWHSCMSAYLYIVETPKTMRKQFIVRSVCSLDSIPFTISIFQTSYVESRSLCHSISLSSLYLLPLISWKYSFPLSFLVYLFFDKSGADHEDIVCYNISKQE